MVFAPGWCPGASPRSFDWGGRIPTGGKDSDEPKPPTLKFRLLLGFRPLYFGNTEKFQLFGIFGIFGKYSKKNP